MYMEKVKYCKVIVLSLIYLAVISITTYATIVYQDDFQSYDVENPSDFSVNSVPTGNWSSSNTGADATRIFDTGNFGGTRLWVCRVDGTTLTSKGIDLDSNREYVFSAVLVSETNDGSRQLDVTYDLRLGSDTVSATSIIGGPVVIVTHGDNWGIDNTKEDNIFTHDFATPTLNPGDKLFIDFTRVGVHAGSDPWLGVDDVLIMRSIKIKIDESDGKTEVVEGDPTGDTYEVYLKSQPLSNVTVAVNPDISGGDPEIDLGKGPGVPIELFFDPGNWSTHQVITVVAVDDQDQEGIHEVNISHTTSSADPNFDTQVATVTVNVIDDDLSLIESDVFVGGQEGPAGTSNYRIPGMTLAPDGTILAFAEGRRSGSDPGAAGYPIDMVMKRSTNGGMTWEPLVVLHSDVNFDYSDPRPITDWETGRVNFLYAQWPDDCGQTCVPPGLGDNSSVIFLQTSDDNGQTWSGPININSQIKDPSWRALNTGPGHGIQLKWQADPARNGRLITPGHYNSSNGISIYSDDHGTSWQSGSPISGASLNESEVVELTNGDLLWDARWSDYRKHAISHDGGETWTYIGLGDFVITAVDCSLARYSAKRDGQDRDRLIFSGPLGNPPGSGSGRYNIGVWTSYDEGKTFINPVQFDDGHGAYSAIQRLSDGRIGLLYEATSNTLIRLINFDLIHLEGQAHRPELTHYDGFGNMIDRKRGGMGWSGSWSNGATFTDSFVSAFGGSSIHFEGYGYPMENDRIDLIEGQSTQRNLTTPINLNKNVSTYISFVISPAKDTSPNDNTQEFLNIKLHDDDNVPYVSCGVQSDESIFIDAPGNTVSTEENYLNRNRIYFLVLKIVSQDDESPNNYDQVFLHVFESGVEAIPDQDNDLDWTLVGTTNENSGALIDRISVEGGGSATWSFDELRIGLSFSVVAGNTTPYCGQPGTVYYVGDLNHDCYIDIHDLVIFSSYWLKCTDPFYPETCDLFQ